MKKFLKKSKYSFENLVILGGSKGIGKSIYKNINHLSKNCFACSRKDIDTSNIQSVLNFSKKFKEVDAIILNSGGPPPKPFKKITEDDWMLYFKQMFLGYVILLNNIKIKKNGYIFYISSSIINQPDEHLMISSSLRVAFSSLLKSLSKNYSGKNISTINIAPGPFKTNRVKELVSDMRNFEKKLPTGKIGNPDEIGLFVKYVMENRIKYLSGSTIYFDGNINKNFM